MDNRQDVRVNSSDFAAIGEAIAQRNRRTGVFKNNTGPPPERRSTISSMMPCSSYQVTRMRNLSGGSSGSTASGSSCGSSTQLDNQYLPTDNQIAYFSMEIAPFANNASTVQGMRGDSSSSSHRKLDRSLSDGDSDRPSHRSVNSSRYKTELCRPFEESGSCKYGDKCQFAHGYHELRNLARHPKYKTELCRTFHTVGFCPYGPRCHFIHADEKVEASPKLARQASGKGSSSNYTQPSSGSTSPSLSPSGSDDYSTFSYQSESSPQPNAALNVENRQINSLTVNINNYGSSNFDLQSLGSKFSSALNLNSSNCVNDNVSTGSISSTNGSRDMKPACQEQRDIFSEITMFCADEIVDNFPKASSSNVPPVLDNFHYLKDSLFWQTTYRDMSRAVRPMDAFHHSPTGSVGSDSGNSSDCGSTESLASTGFTDWHRPVGRGPF